MNLIWNLLYRHVAYARFGDGLSTACTNTLLAQLLYLICDEAREATIIWTLKFQ